MLKAASDEGQDRSEWEERYLELCNHLRSRRENILQLTQRGMAKRIGCDQSRIQRVESGRLKLWNPVELLRFARGYQLSEELTDEWSYLLFRVRLSKLPAQDLGQPKWQTKEPAPKDHALLDEVRERAPTPTNTEKQLLAPEVNLARDIINAHLLDKNRTLSDVAATAGIADKELSDFMEGGSAIPEQTALKLYESLAKEMSDVTRRTFLKSISVMALTVLAPDFFPEGKAELRSVLHDDPLQIAQMLLARARILDWREHQWEKAYALSRLAEHLCGPQSNQAAVAGLLGTQMLLNLNRYQQAWEEVKRIEQSYASAMDAPARIDLFRLKGWLDYYQGQFPRAASWLAKTVEIANEAGLESLADYHFRGRVNLALGKQAKSEKRDISFAQSEKDLMTSLHKQHKDLHESTRAFDKLRLAQLRRAQGKGVEAKELLGQTRMMFANDLAAVHVDLEEADMDLEDGEDLLNIIIKAEGGFRQWAEVKYVNGVTEALRILALAELLRGESRRALAYYIALWCLSPLIVEKNQQIQEEMSECYDDILYRGNAKAWRKFVSEVQEAIVTGRGPLAYLRQMATHQCGDISELINLLERQWQSIRE
jgi:transcriptional regulator with XRE-family HTH domain